MFICVKFLGVIIIISYRICANVMQLLWWDGVGTASSGMIRNLMHMHVFFKPEEPAILYPLSGIVLPISENLVW